MMTQLRDDDSGFGLAELLVAIVVGTVVLAGLGTTFLASLNGSQNASARITATADVRLALDTMARRLRVAVRPEGEPAAFVAASTDGVTFYASLRNPGSTADPVPTLVEYSIDTASRCLRESKTPAGPGGNWPSSGRVSTCLGFGDVNTDGSPLFRFWDGGTSAGVQIPVPAGGLASADLSRVQSVEVIAAFADVSGRAPTPTRARTRVTLTNVAAAAAAGRP